MTTDLTRDAAEVRGMETRDPWRKALLIVRNVWAAPNHRPTAQEVHDRGLTGKVSAEAFAAEVNLRGWGVNVIARNITAWNRAAEAGLVPPARDMSPGQELESPSRDWSEFYDGTEGDKRYQQGPARDALVHQAREDGVGASKVMDIAKNTAAMASAIKADPDVARVAREAVERAAESERLEYQARVIANGGRIPSLDEINQSDSPSDADVFIDQAERFAALIAPVRRSIEALRAAGPWGEDTTEANDIRGLNLLLLDCIAAGVRS